jgi:hypothetical protein
VKLARLFSGLVSYGCILEVGSWVEVLHGVDIDCLKIA